MGTLSNHNPTTTGETTSTKEMHMQGAVERMVCFFFVILFFAVSDTRSQQKQTPGEIRNGGSLRGD
jgi:hypothetical protein